MTCRIWPLLALLGGCAPTIYHFEATPNRVCKGEKATLRWAATHGGNITASPPNESPGAVFGEGASVVTPSASGSYHLEATNVIFSSGADVRVDVDACAAPPAPEQASAQR